MSARSAQLAALVVLPFLLAGLVNRVKSLWSGRKGAPLLQLAFDVARLLRKRSVYSTTSTAVFRIGPWVLLVTTLASATIVPLLGARPLAAFPFDFVWLAYLWGLGRAALVLAALDTGSAFEGMGAARDATFATLLEPVLFLVAGALCLLSDTHSLHEALTPELASGPAVVVWAGALAALLIVLQVECGRIPVDDPSTHLELTMVHEVMVLDHSGPELAAIQYCAALKLLIGSSLVATLLNPWGGSWTLAAVLAQLALLLAIAVVVGTIESLSARLKLRSVPHYIVVALASGAIALLATAWRAGGTA